jgi:hypothetical protein
MKENKIIINSVYAIYQCWSLAKKPISYPPSARKQAVDYVLGKVFTEFLASLPKEESTIRLTETIN